MNTQQRICNRICLFAVAVLLFVASFAGWNVFVPQVEASAATSVDSYYANLNESLTGDAFRAELANLITSTHTHETTYDDLREVFKQSDVDPDNPNNILWFYTGTSVSFSGFGSGIGTTNREHVWPKSAGNAFPAESKAGSDAHHLRPTEAQLNSTRNDMSFGEVPQIASNIVSENGKKDYDNLCYTNGTFFYPGEGYRGQTARILMYVQTRWGDAYDLKFVDAAGNVKTIGKISDLMKWHLMEPPTEEEIYRNNVVASIQGNRNPFIDHPEYAEKIYCYDGESYNNALLEVVAEYGNYNTAEIEGITLNPASTSVVVGETVTVNASLTPSNAKNDLVWTSSNTQVATVSRGRVTGVANGTATITAYSESNPNVRATATVTVKSVQSIAVSGTPTKTNYYAGESFDPTGLTVVATYSDGSKATVSNSSCSWLDVTTKQTALSKGATSVLCVLANAQQTVGGITVSSVQMQNVTVTRDSFSGSGAYAWQTWTASGISGQAYMYAGTAGKIQMNTNSRPYYYIYNTTPIPGSILSITIKLSENQKDFEIRTSTTPFEPTSSKTATGGTVHGTKSVSTDGTTWTINTTDPYFAINYMSTGVVYIDSIVISYGEATEQEHVHNYGSWQAEVPATCQTTGTVGHYYCEGCKTYFDQSKQEITNLTIAKADHVLGSWNEGYAGTCVENGQLGHYQCTVCNEYFDSNKNQLSTIVVPAGNCELNNWVEETPSTCQEQGTMAHFLCTLCGKTYNEQGTLVTNLTLPLGDHNFGEWSVDQQPTCKEKGSQSATCSVCGDVKTEELDKLAHTYGEWFVAIAPTINSVGEEQRVCENCGTRQRNEIAQLTATEAFHPYVEQLGNGAMAEQFQAINSALAFYNSLTADQQAEVATDYATLQSAIDAYNSAVQNVNAQHQQSSNVAVGVMCAQGVVALAICAFVVGKRFF